jgi:hypothetical protein
LVRFHDVNRREAGPNAENGHTRLGRPRVC